MAGTAIRRSRGHEQQSSDTNGKGQCTDNSGYDTGRGDQDNGQILQVDLDKIERMYEYELENKIPHAKRVIEWFGDYAMAMIATGRCMEKRI